MMPEVATGEIVIALKPVPLAVPAGIAFVLEVHTEDDTHWGGYARGLDPYASFKFYPKDRFLLLDDRRGK